MGYASVGKMLGEVTSEEISEWQAYFNIKESVTEDHEKAHAAKQKAKQNNR